MEPSSGENAQNQNTVDNVDEVKIVSPLEIEGFTYYHWRKYNTLCNFI